MGLVVALVGLFVSRWLFWPFAAFTVFSLYFFRDPERTPPGRPGSMVSPADGRVVSVMLAVPPAELGLGPTPRWRVATFLSVLNVHVNRVPATAEVTRIAYRHGAFVNASLDKASDANERNALAMRLPDGRDFAVVQIAGLIARRILCDAKVGDTVRGGRTVRHHPLRQPHRPVSAGGRPSPGRGRPDDGRRRDGDGRAGMSGIRPFAGPAASAAGRATPDLPSTG